MDNNISFSKIVATPTLNSWSQAYNAGKLFAVLSLEKTEDLKRDLESLNILGKELLERLEQEFFTLEDKNLESIKKAISNTFELQVEGISFSFAAGAFINAILYLFALGRGKVFIKRDGNFGKVLDSTNSDTRDIISSSGFLKENDLIVLSTEAFAEVFSNDELNSNLNGLPVDITESLAPKVHKAENGKISAIIIKYGNPKNVEEPIADEIKELNETEKSEEVMAKSISPFDKYLSLLKSKLKRRNIRVHPTRKVFLSAAIVIIFILIFGIYFSIQKQNNAKVQALFAQVYKDAVKKYDEGNSLSDLNKNLARDSFLSAQKILNDNKDKFPPKSKELAQTQDLSRKVETELAKYSPVDSSGLDRSKLSVAVENGSGIEGTAGKAGEILKEFGYNVVSTGNADNYNYQGVTIKVKKDKSDFANLLKKDLAKEYTITTTSPDLSPDSSSDALIIIGK